MNLLGIINEEKDGKEINQQQEDEKIIENQRNFYSLMFLTIAFGTGLGTFLQNFAFSLTGERLTCRLKAHSYRSILEKDVE